MEKEETKISPFKGDKTLSFHSLFVAVDQDRRIHEFSSHLSAGCCLASGSH